MKGRKPKFTVKEVFDVMAENDFKVKKASPVLKISKSAIYNLIRNNKVEWHQLLNQRGKADDSMEGQTRSTGVKKWADHKIDRKNRGVKSDMENKYVGKTFPISEENDQPGNLQQVQSAKEQHETKQADKPVNVMRSPTGESLKDENARLVKQNKELGEALERANKENTAIAEEHNSLIDDYNRAKNDLEDYRKALKAREEEKKHLQERLEKSQDLSKHYQDVIKEIQHNHSKLGETELLDDYHVKLGKVYVDDQQMISKEIFEMDIEKAKAVADFSGGQIYQTAIVPYKEGESDV